MLDVYFETKKEANTFSERLLVYNPTVEIHWKKRSEWGYRVLVSDMSHQHTDHIQKEFISKAMTDVFILHREMNWIYDVIKKKYYYDNCDEIQRIADITQSIIAGEDIDLVHVFKNKKPRDSLLGIFRTNMKESVIHFQSIVNFRMQPYRKELIDVIGLAIDEFKREEEYQTFIHSLREYVSRKKMNGSVIHVLQGGDFTFFKENGEKYTSVELKRLIKKEPLYIVGLDDNELNLTPILAMAPKQIYIYGNDPTEPKTLTVQNIFEERMTFLPATDFPFNQSFHTN
ncbi:sporulation protein YtxC [Aquibacillus salsiterrae]|uniref:Sporulation protein YtxC n=1 Tax=Aquibacillus salsiterrae TaxID=2950439 RepID=A0A9X3WCC1_9BACI|nr:sporulation protein YtxC [Aquibacillus salsiterrae]MDC3415731.1 putative sporulation protein YtxC [Aquibacillus salsiterrae]